MSQRLPTIVLGTLSLFLGWAWVQGDSGAPNVQNDSKQSALMRAKLASTQRIVDGLVSKDFNDIAKGADEIMKICKAEEWEARQDDVYGHHRRELMLQAEKISAAAQRENLDGAAYSFIHSLTTCISCHEYCRDVLKIADVEEPTRIVPIPTADEAIAPTRTRR